MGRGVITPILQVKVGPKIQSEVPGVMWSLEQDRGLGIPAITHGERLGEKAGRMPYWKCKWEIEQLHLVCSYLGLQGLLQTQAAC